jgi:hypothetical protein
MPDAILLRARRASRRNRRAAEKGQELASLHRGILPVDTPRKGACQDRVSRDDAKATAKIIAAGTA